MREGESVHAFSRPKPLTFFAVIRADNAAPQLPTERLAQASKTSTAVTVFNSRMFPHHAHFLRLLFSRVQH